MSGFMRGNHTFLIWETPQDAAQAVSDGIQQDDADTFEMAFIGHGHGAKSLHRELHEWTPNFLARSETFFRKAIP